MSECRVCLIDNVRMHLISNTRYRELYEKLSGTKLSTEDGRPNTLCYICNSLLQKFCKFFDMSQKAEKILTKRLLGFEVSQEIKDNVKIFHDLTITSTRTMTYIDNGEDEGPEVTVTVKEEPVDFDESEQFKEEYLESPPADETLHAGNTTAELTFVNRLHLPEKSSTQPDFLNTELNKDVCIKIEKATALNEVNSQAESFLRNLSMALDIPLKHAADFKYHPNTGNREYNYYCNACKYKSRTALALKRHTKVHDPSLRYPCEFCSYRFVNETKLSVHRNYCTVCSICGKRFSNIHGLRIHVRLHTGVQPYSCDICGRGFNQKTNLQTHMRVHSRDKQYPCQFCNKSFPFNSFLQRHMLIHGESPLDTESFRRIINCHKLFTRKKTDKSCMCNICGRILQSKEGLNSHIKLHTGEKPFACESCGRVFTQKHNLFTHVERVHARDEMFTCCVCHKMFPFNSEMRQHLLTHIGAVSARDFEMFQQKHIYTIHRRSNHRQLSPYPCDMCKTRVLSY